MVKAFVIATIGLTLLSASANAQKREHRAGQPGYTPGGGVTVQQGGRCGRSSTSKVVKVQPAPNVPQQKNWGIPHPISGCPGCGTFPSNVRDHRSVRR
jgi:hypothetical protein